MPLLKDIAEYLEDQSVGTVGTDIFIGQMPADVDACVAVFAYAGQPPDLNFEDMEFPGLQVIIRGAKDTFDTANTKAELVLTTLKGLTDTTLTATYYYRISANQSVAQLGFDKNDRPRFVVNFAVQKEMG